MEEKESCRVWNCYSVYSSYQGERPVSDQCFAEDQCKGIFAPPLVSFIILSSWNLSPEISFRTTIERFYSFVAWRHEFSFRG